MCMLDGQVYTWGCVWLHLRGEVQHSPVFIEHVTSHVSSVRNISHDFVHLRCVGWPGGSSHPVFMR